MKLYNYWRSSASWRVRIALAWKGLPYEYVPVHLVRDGGEQNGPVYLARNAMSQVPTLELDDGRSISQSMAILEYLEEQHPQPALLPRDPWLRARARQLAEIVNSGIQPLQNSPVLDRVKGVLAGDEQGWTRHFIARGLGALERSAALTVGRFLVADQPTFADLCLVPQLYNARRFSVDLTPLPTLVRVEELCLTMPVFAASHPDRQPDAQR